MRRLSALALALGLICATAAGAEEVSRGTGAVLRMLDKLSGDVRDIDLANGQSFDQERIRVSLGECRYPTGNPSGDAYAFVTVIEEGRDAPVFIGWMIASSPALSAMDHPRYDVWVLRCRTE
ncbi:DUF2155 domain-containing protein [Marimonas lutisalis]|uniref:DUF2155 domain-containing protein n=1 Tax=Marimonas lutisalis TaxID=2545756 RepID=UPI0010F4C83E|nr:DUF2155 domain-containing protein [Marimonas lutisalis]